MTLMVKRAIVEIDEEGCNGCGQCIPKCAEGALKIMDGKARLMNEVYCDGLGVCLGTCPRDAIKITEREAPAFDEEAAREYNLSKQRKSKLRNWPVQLNLVNPSASFFKDANLLVMADCVPVASPDWQNAFLLNQVVLVGCPKFDDTNVYINKFIEIFKHNELKGVTTVNMEVPCCSGLVSILKIAIKESGKSIPVNQLVLSTEGRLL